MAYSSKLEVSVSMYDSGTPLDGVAFKRSVEDTDKAFSSQRYSLSGTNSIQLYNAGMAYNVAAEYILIKVSVDATASVTFTYLDPNEDSRTLEIPIGGFLLIPAVNVLLDGSTCTLSMSAAQTATAEVLFITEAETVA